ncbi:uncharacterized protein TNCT_312921 [Trichonephila clavata]|uniref:Uncharacterized protein n=1 Tax=Trichonephila clavata TaxID=2740835 RepID=A0A8X6IT74_TRICU|nr:uncharacterized protein TNCT_312921 [Trichonephila clavata]
MTSEPRYGFMYLKRTGSAYMIHCFTDSLYENMISCGQAANSYQMDTVDSDCRLKIAYFKVLNNNDIVRELHNGFAMNHRQIFDCLTDSESDGEQLFSPPPPKEKYSNEKRKARVEKKEEPSKKPRTDYNFSDPAEERKIIPPISAYLGKGLTISIKEYRKSFYLSLQKTVGEDTKNRFNMNLEQLGALKKAINVFNEHIKKN